MSTSISFAISSADQEAPTSKSFVDLRKDNGADYYLKPERAATGATNEPYERRHTGLGSTGAERDFFELGPHKLKRWRHHTHRDSLSDSKSVSREDDQDEGPADFYEEVDERMSRNSLEYPEHQARYIDRWLTGAGAQTGPRSRSFDDDHHYFQQHNNSDHIKGNVIGIRGFASDNSIGSNRYNKLKSDYLKLQSDHNKLRSRFEEASRQYNKIFKRKDTDLEALKSLVMKQCKRMASNDPRDRSPGSEWRCNKCPSNGRPSRGSLELELDKLRHELRRLELSRGHKDREHEQVVDNLRAANERLHGHMEAKEAEIDNLQNQIKKLALEPENRKLLTLHNENVRLRDASQADQLELRALQENYAKLNEKLRSMCQEQEIVDNERNAETNRLFVELCRLQVYQPKLETLLDTERKIKQELQELNLERSRTVGMESIEVEAVRGQLAHLKERLQRLEREKQDADELLRVSRSKVAHLDRSYQNELSSLREANQMELEKAKADLNKVSLERDSLVTRVDELGRQLELSEKAASRLDGQVLELHQRLADCNGAALNRETGNKLEQLQARLKSAEDRMGSLADQLETSESKRREVADELADKRNQLEQSSGQVAELRRRLELQTAALDELREKKDKELARLRVDLNFEQYNRQVALKGLERELRASLKELETMKYRFSKRLNVESDTSSIRLNGRTVHFGGPANETAKAQQAPDSHKTSRQQQQQQQHHHHHHHQQHQQAANSLAAAKLIADPNRDEQDNKGSG